METKAVLKGLSLFAGLDDPAIEQMASIAERKTYGTGATVFTEGDADASLFVIVRGSVKIDKQVNFDQQQTLHQLKAGDFFGEISFVLGGAHVATAQVREETELLLIRRTEFDKLAKRDPEIAYRFMTRMATQLATLLRTMDEKFVELVGYIWGRSKK